MKTMKTVKEVIDSQKLMHAEGGFISPEGYLRINESPIQFEGVGFYSLTPEGYFIRAKIPTTTRIMLIKRNLDVRFMGKKYEGTISYSDMTTKYPRKYPKLCLWSNGKYTGISFKYRRAAIQRMLESDEPIIL